jgi:hypothetical protein
MKDSKIKLIQKIKDSFQNFDLKINKAYLTINDKNDFECKEIQEVYANRTWEDILKNLNDIDGSNISFMTPKAIAQFIPAFMIYTIQDVYNADTLMDNLESFLLNLEIDLDMYIYNEKRRKEFFSLLSNEQQQTIESFIEYLMLIEPEDFKFLLINRLNFRT